MAVKKAVSELKVGDTFVHEGEPVWIVLRDAVTDDVEVEARVQYVKDGGIETRYWGNPAHELTVEPAK
jgi:hypothetical protein